jgi:hypothetical protein
MSVAHVQACFSLAWTKFGPLRTNHHNLAQQVTIAILTYLLVLPVVTYCDLLQRKANEGLLIRRSTVRVARH